MLRRILLCAALLTATPLKADSPPALAEALVEQYLAAIDGSAALLADRPPAGTVSAQFEALREERVQAIFAIGQKVAMLDAGGRAQVEAAVNSVNARLQYDPALKPRYDAYFEAVKHYFSTDREFARRLQTINILTQYAFFDLLRKQEPAEAARLGLDPKGD